MACRRYFRFDVAGMKRMTFFITGTDTGVGKTVLTALLAGYGRECGVSIAALKPVCSGGRDDARVLGAALNGVLTLDEINPWHFRAPIAPSLAARQERKRVRLASVLAHIRRLQARFDVLLVEGAGGLLSPLGEDFNSRDLIVSLRATPMIVGLNRLGAVNQVLLALEALPPDSRQKARVILMSLPRPDIAAKSNPGLLAEHSDGKRIFTLPWPGGRFNPARGSGNFRVRRTLRELVSGL